jgi:4-azaleucine resistance transporter AzlC
MTTRTAAAPLTRPNDLRDAAREAGVVWTGLFALGVGFGVLVTSHGLPWWLAPIISATTLAGSVEFLLAGLLAAAAPVTAVALTTFLVNSRHLFYGLSFPLHRITGRLPRAYSVFALTDEAYALTAGKDPDELTGRRILWTQFGLHASWVAGALAGGLVGHRLLDDVKGLGFVLTALFVVLAMDAFRDSPDLCTLAAALCSAVVALLVAPASMLLLAMSVFTASLAARHHLSRRGRGPARA